MSGLNYEEVSDITLRLSEDADACELDGLIAGMLVCGPGVPPEKIVKTMVAYLQDGEAKTFDALQQGALVQLMADLAEHAQGLHAVDDMEWAPLQPSDEAGLVAQLEGLALWCAGFIHGVGVALGAPDGDLAASVKEEELSESSRELLADMAEISRVDVDSIAESDAEEDYAEILEYVRTAAFTCALEFSHLKGNSPPAPTPDTVQ